MAEAVKAKSYKPEALEVLNGRIRATCFPKQLDYVFDPALRISLLTGSRAGKTAATLMRLLRALIAQDYARCAYVAITRGSAKNIIWGELKKVVGKLGLHNVSFKEIELICTLPNGSELHVYGSDDNKDIDKLRGVSWNEVAIDEAASMQQERLDYLVIEVLGPRTPVIILLGTPGKILSGRFYEATRNGGTIHSAYAARTERTPEDADKWSSHSWSLDDGVAAGIAELIRLKKVQDDNKRLNGLSDTNPIHLREHCGLWVADDKAQAYQYKPHDEHGNQFNQWSPDKSPLGIAKLPKHWRATEWGYGIGIDFGYKDAFALEAFAFSYEDPSRTLYHVYEFYGPTQFCHTIAKLIIGPELSHDRYGGIVSELGWPVFITGDFAGSGGSIIAELDFVYGIKVKKSDKDWRNKLGAITSANGELYEGRVKIMQGSALETEMMTLQLVEDATGKLVEDKKQANHGTDAFIYLRQELATLLPAPDISTVAANAVEPAKPVTHLPPKLSAKKAEPARPQEPELDSSYESGDSSVGSGWL